MCEISFREVIAMHKLPLIVKQLARQRYSNTFGPNCWNATLIFHGEYNRPECVKEVEMLAWLRNHTRPLQQDEQLQWGDVIVYGDFRDHRCKTLDHDARFYLAHTCVFLTKTRVWNKTGCDRGFPWEIVSKKEVDIVYGANAAGNPRYRGIGLSEPCRTSHQEYRRVIK
jgi:hypothetical protein